MRRLNNPNCKEMTPDDALKRALKDTENNNNISVMDPFLVTINSIVCYSTDYINLFTFKFDSKCLIIKSTDYKLWKNFYYTDERVLNLLLTITLFNEGSETKQYFEDLKSKIILSLL